MADPINMIIFVLAIPHSPRAILLPCTNPIPSQSPGSMTLVRCQGPTSELYPEHHGRQGFPAFSPRAGAAAGKSPVAKVVLGCCWLGSLDILYLAADMCIDSWASWKFMSFLLYSCQYLPDVGRLCTTFLMVFQLHYPSWKRSATVQRNLLKLIWLWLKSMQMLISPVERSLSTSRMKSRRSLLRTSLTPTRRGSSCKSSHYLLPYLCYGML